MKIGSFMKFLFILLIVTIMAEAYRNPIPLDMVVKNSDAIVIAKLSSVKIGKEVEIDGAIYTKHYGDFIVATPIKGSLKKGDKISLLSYKGEQYYHHDFIQIPAIDTVVILALKRNKDGEWISSYYEQGLSLFEADQPPQSEIDRVIQVTREIMNPRYKECKPLVELRRGICYGTCPEYSVTICDDGQVIYVGKSHVSTIGERRTYIDSQSLDEVLSTFRESNYLSLNDFYTNISATDFPSYYLSITIDGKAKYISHYAGDESAPKILYKLEDKIDEIIARGKKEKSSIKSKYRWMSE